MNIKVANTINVYNVIQAFKQFGISLSLIEANLMMKRFDPNRDGQLTYTDICDVFRPRNVQLAKEFDLRMPYDHQISNQLTQTAVNHITKVFQTLVKVENNIELMKKQLASRPNFDVSTAFRVLNKDGYEKVSEEDLQNILKVHGLITFQK